MIMKRLTVIMSLLIACQFGYSGSVYDDQIKKLAVELADLVEKRGVEKVAIWNFTGMNGSDHLSKYLLEDFSVHFTNATQTIQVFDRQHLDEILEELRLHQSGLIDPQTAKDLGTFTGVEAIITGQYTLSGKKIKLWVKAIETESAYQIAALNGQINWSKKQFPKTISKKRNEISERGPRLEKARTSKKKGSLKLINQKNTTLYVNVKRGDFEKKVLVGSDSSSEILALSPGIYDCEAGYENSKTAIETFQVKIRPYKRSKKKFKGFRFSAFSLMF